MSRSPSLNFDEADERVKQIDTESLSVDAPLTQLRSRASVNTLTPPRRSSRLQRDSPSSTPSKESDSDKENAASKPHQKSSITKSLSGGDITSLQMNISSPKNALTDVNPYHSATTLLSSTSPLTSSLSLISSHNSPSPLLTATLSPSVESLASPEIIVTSSRARSRSRMRTVSTLVADGKDVDENSESPPYPRARRRSRSRSPFIVDWATAPDFTKDNPYIHHGYRVNMTWGKSAKSLFRLHNETFNVWTHILAFFFTIALFVALYLYMPMEGHQYAWSRFTNDNPVEFWTTTGTVEGYSMRNNLQWFANVVKYPAAYFASPAAVSRAEKDTAASSLAFATKISERDSFYANSHPSLHYHPSMPRFCQKYYASLEGDDYDVIFDVKNDVIGASRGALTMDNLTFSQEKETEESSSTSGPASAPVPVPIPSPLSLDTIHAHHPTKNRQLLPLVRHFPVQCLPPRDFDPSLALQVKQFFKNLPQSTRDTLHEVKHLLKKLTEQVPVQIGQINTRWVSTQAIKQTSSSSPSSSPSPSFTSTTSNVEEMAKEMLMNVRSSYDKIKAWAKFEAVTISDEVSTAMVGVYSSLADMLHPVKVSLQAAAAKTSSLVPSSSSEDKIDITASSEDFSGVTTPSFYQTFLTQTPSALLQYLDFEDEYIDSLPIWPILLYLISAMVCFSFSAIFHLFYAISPSAYLKLSGLDYAGISVLIGGSNVPMTFYLFYCESGLAKFYIGFMVIACLACFVFTLLPCTSGPKYRAPRTFLFIVLGLAGTVSFAHRSILAGFDPVLWFYLAMVGVTYIGGAMIYLANIPERYFPGKFDICCHSHQIWHIFVFAAAMVHFVGIKYIYQWRILHVCPVGADLLDW